MDRRRFLLSSLAGALAVPLAAGAQQSAKVYRIGELREGSTASSKAFVDAMREFGWVEGQNFKIEKRIAERRDQLPALAAELVRLNVDLILTGGTSATRAVREATKTIPVVFNLATDPVDSGLVSSLARPGGNLTGFALGIYDEKLMEILKEALPSISRVVYPGAGTPGLSPRQANLNIAGRILGVDTHGIAVQGPEDFDRFFAAAKRAGAEAILIVNVAWFRPHLKRIGGAAAKSRLPAVGYAREFSESGGLLSYGPKPGQNVVRVAAQVDKILKGANPAELPVEQPTKFELVINLKTAKTIGLTIPPSLLARADQVIE